ncbi:sigma-70 family RNA polymerase sigma factor [Bombilactobacillus bombi]|uniref:sigma-70 family RNA polymerase sigma factor n=1 Tax=Bombilactobacillus bombi TaxID=1303590 RepID=UPI0015E5CA04|nr:sigma-70 family RNA polymerase sigma factor [Bombilactobacillus bombi]MBA1434142.1 sigma-70 family RNA polymerase sigma factor [Bombilactobacillus bombi]
MKTQQLLNQDLNWITQVKELNSSQALEQLFTKYLPLVEKYGQIYHIPLFDRADWYQEARLVCYQTCLIFNGNHGSKFGSFFKLRLQNRAANLLREQLALKRQTNIKSVSMEHLSEVDPELKSLLCLRSDLNNNSEFISFDYGSYLQTLSELELLALKVCLGLHPQAVNNYSKSSLMRAAQRARLKLRQLC